MTKTKMCEREGCGEKPITSFYLKHSRGGSERESICKSCTAADARVDKLTPYDQRLRNERIASRKSRNFVSGMVFDKPVKVIRAKA